MKQRRSIERTLWTSAALTALSILLLAAWGRAIQHVIEQYLGKEFIIVITVFFCLAGLLMFRFSVLKHPNNRFRRLISFLLVVGFYAWRLTTLTVHVERFHLIEFGVLAILVCMAMQRHNQGWGAIGWGFAAAWLVGLADELFQWWLPARVGEWRDVLINMQSGALGLAAYLLLGFDSFRHALIHRRDIARLLVVCAALSALSGSFILTVHLFGHRNTDPTIGTFQSFFTLEQLAGNTTDEYRIQYERAAQRTETEAIPDVYVHFYNREGKEHFDWAHLLIELNRLPEAKSEYLLTETYFRPWMEVTGTYFSDSTVAGLSPVVPVPPGEFVSHVFDWVFVSMTRQQVRLVSLSAALLFLLIAAGVYSKRL
ncbi:VanZ family protein [bacterium]|nr:VanZ family protein [candidate division CSSED10-310 bacterium]